MYAKILEEPARHLKQMHSYLQTTSHGFGDICCQSQHLFFLQSPADELDGDRRAIVEVGVVCD